MKKALLSVHVAAAALLVHMPMTFAATAGSSEETVCIYHASKTPAIAELVSADGQTRRSLGGFQGRNTPTVRLNPGDSVRVRVCDYNPVLFSYTVTEHKEDVPSLAAATTFASAIQTAVAGFAGKERGEDLEISGLSVEVLRNAIDDLNGLARQIPELAEATTSLSAQALEEKQRAVAAWPVRTKPLQSLLAKLEAIDAASANGTALVVINPDTGQPVPGSTTLDDVKDGLRRTFAGDKNADRLSGLLSQVNYLQYVIRRLDEIKASANTVNVFITAFAQVNRAEKSPQLLVSHNSTIVDKVNVAVAPNAAFASLLTENTRTFQKEKSTSTDPFVIKVEPREAVHLSIAPGAVYSFVRQTKYTAKANSGGSFTIAANESEYAAVSGAVVLNVTPDSYFGRGTQFFGQIGIAPESDKIAFLLGAGLRLYDRGVLSLGLIYQERDVLAQGLSVGTALASEEDLKLDQEFKLGAYIGLSFNLSTPAKK